jgi:hypothetical protein
MMGLRIRDLEERVLAFDLRELVELLGAEAVTSRWKCVVEDYVPAEHARPNLWDASFASGSVVDGADLVDRAAETLQVIDGRFEAFRRGDDEPWLRLEAIDSSYWEVFASDPALLVRFRHKFQQVGDL